MKLSVWGDVCSGREEDLAGTVHLAVGTANFYRSCGKVAAVVRFLYPVASVRLFLYTGTEGAFLCAPCGWKTRPQSQFTVPSSQSP